MEDENAQPKYQITQLPNGNIAIGIISDEHPGKAVKHSLAQFAIDDVVTLGKSEYLIEGITLRPYQRTPYVASLTTWEICYFLKETCTNRPHSAAEIELLMYNDRQMQGAMFAAQWALDFAKSIAM